MRPTSLKTKPSELISWVWAVGLILAPLSYILFISFMDRGTYGGIVFHPQLTNYAKIFDAGMFSLIGSAFLRSVVVAFLTTLLCLALGLPLALFLVFKAGKWKNILFFLLVIPFWTQFLIRVYAWMTILSDNGILNRLFGVNWLFSYKAILIGMVYNYLPYMTMSLYVNLEKLDKSLLDAAADLGASGFARFYKIVLPLSVPGIVAGTIMVFIPALGEFVIPDVLGGGKNFFVGNLLTQQFLSVRDWPFGAALSVILMLIVVTSFNLIGKYKSSDQDLEESLL